MSRMASGNYGDSSCSSGYCPTPLSLTSCILTPPYPVTSMGMGGGMGSPMMGAPTPAPTEQDSQAIEKYNQDYQKYTQDYQTACKQDVLRQQGQQKNSLIVDLSGYMVALLLTIAAAFISLMAIRKAEEL